MLVRALLAACVALTSVTALPVPASTPDEVKSLHVECTLGSCSPAEMAQISAYLEAIKNNPGITSYEVTSEIMRIYDDDTERVDPPNKVIDDDTVSIQKRDDAPTAAPVPVSALGPVAPGPVASGPVAPGPVASDPAIPTSAAKDDTVVVQVAEGTAPDDATKSEIISQAEEKLVHCSSEEGGCTDEQIAEVENGVSTAGWGFLKPIWDLIRKFKFSYGIDVGNNAIDTASAPAAVG